MSITDEIISKLDIIEKNENVRIIHCVESGSRAWGFASPDSDYDVRFIYVHQPEYYLHLEKQRDVIEFQLNDVYDINGWDLQKALRLLYKSNPTIFEWNNSPIVYRTTPEYQLVREIIDSYFCSKSGLYHYISTAKSNYREYLRTEQVKLKKYFYCIRPILACKWIQEKNTPPPMLFTELADAVLEDELKPTINELLERKMKTPEIGTGARIDVLNEYIEQNIDEISSELSQMENEEYRSWDKLNDTFIKIVCGQD